MGIIRDGSGLKRNWLESPVSVNMVVERGKFEAGYRPPKQVCGVRVNTRVHGAKPP